RAGNRDPPGSLPAPGILTCRAFHRLRIPGDGTFLEVAVVGQKRRAGRPEAKYRIFDDRLARADGVEERHEMVVAVAVTGWRLEDLFGPGPQFHLLGILRAILLEPRLLKGGREGVRREPGFLRTGSARERHTRPAYRDHAVGSDETKRLA